MAVEISALLAVVVAIDHGPGRVEELSLVLAAGATLGDAVNAAGWARDTDAGIWGRSRPMETVLKDGDRVEVYRALRVDPKTARRERFRRQGARGTGLFARRPPEGASGD